MEEGGGGAKSYDCEKAWSSIIIQYSLGMEMCESLECSQSCKKIESTLAFERLGLEEIDEAYTRDYIYSEE
jgi:hypothetical protein